MDLNDISCSLGPGVGKLVGGTRKVLSWPGSTLSKAIEKLRSVFPSANIRAIVTEELMRFMAQKEPTEEKLEQRLKIMAETILALQERLDEMVTHGRISETDMLEAIDSIKTADSLTNDERMVLVNVFRQNIALQKPELVETAVG
jgi:hypothetical protein